MLFWMRRGGCILGPGNACIARAGRFIAMFVSSLSPFQSAFALPTVTLQDSGHCQPRTLFMWFHSPLDHRVPHYPMTRGQTTLHGHLCLCPTSSLGLTLWCTTAHPVHVYSVAHLVPLLHISNAQTTALPSSIERLSQAVPPPFEGGP